MQLKPSIAAASICLCTNATAQDNAFQLDPHYCSQIARLKDAAACAVQAAFLDLDSGSGEPIEAIAEAAFDHCEAVFFIAFKFEPQSPANPESMREFRSRNVKLLSDELSERAQLSVTHRKPVGFRMAEILKPIPGCNGPNK